MLTSKLQWVALYTNPRAEKQVERNLQREGFEAYLPMRRELHTWSDRKKWVEVPLLKSYVFAKINNKQEVTVRNVQGVSYLVKFKNDVAVIPEREIQMMKDFLAAEVEIQVRSMELMRQGRRVRINGGALDGKEGILVSDITDGNFAVEITGISMAMVIHVDSDMLELLPEEEEEPKATKEYFF